MILGMTPFTFVHVLLSLAGIASGFVVCVELLSNKWRVGETRSPRRVLTNVEDVPNAAGPIWPGSPSPAPAQRGRGEPGTDLGHEALGGWTAFYLATTVTTSVTGFGFPFDRLLASHLVGIISLVVLAVAIAARYAFHLIGAWRALYVVGVVMGLYFNVFVLVVQMFRRVQFLKEAAPTQTEPPFFVTQLVVLALFIWLGTAGVLKSRGEPAPNKQVSIRRERAS